MDKLYHLAMGVSAVLVMSVTTLLSFGASCALVTTSLGIFYEAQQWYRKEGTPDIWDAVFTALPGFLVWFLSVVFF